MPYHLATSTVKVKTTLPLAETAQGTRSNYLKLSLAFTDRVLIKPKGLLLGYGRHFGAVQARFCKPGTVDLSYQTCLLFS